MTPQPKRPASHLDTTTSSSSCKRARTQQTLNLPPTSHSSSPPNPVAPTETRQTGISDESSESSDSSSTYSSPYTPAVNPTQRPDVLYRLQSPTRGEITNEFHTHTSSDETSSCDSEEEDTSSSEDDTSEDDSKSAPYPASKQTLTPHARLDSQNLQSLQSRITTLFPKLRRANEQLERERENGTLEERDIEALDDQGQYIEMNLGLGVLEEKRSGESSESEFNSESGDDESESESDSDSDSEGDRLEKEAQGRKREDKTEELDVSKLNHHGKKTLRTKKQDVMKQLKGEEWSGTTPSIQVL